uniref:NfeD family protein n=1 Tax=Microbacterium sp. TaxID=51671 RepID=UPI00289C5BB5
MLPDLTQYMWIAWLVLALLFVIIELLTLEFTFLMLATGALIGGLGVNLLGGEWWLQVLAAAAVSALLLFTIRPLLLRALHRSSQLHPTNVDALYGMSARVTSPFVDGRGS